MGSSSTHLMEVPLSWKLEATVQVCMWPRGEGYPEIFTLLPGNKTHLTCPPTQWGIKGTPDRFLFLSSPLLSSSQPHEQLWKLQWYDLAFTFPPSTLSPRWYSWWESEMDRWCTDDNKSDGLLSRCLCHEMCTVTRCLQQRVSYLLPEADLETAWSSFDPPDKGYRDHGEKSTAKLSHLLLLCSFYCAWTSPLFFHRGSSGHHIMQPSLVIYIEFIMVYTKHLSHYKFYISNKSF